MIDVSDANRVIANMHDSTEKRSTTRNGSVYVWGGRSPHIHIYPTLLLEGRCFSALMQSACERGGGL
jgi:hypothetical protein